MQTVLHVNPGINEQANMKLTVYIWYTRYPIRGNLNLPISTYLPTQLAAQNIRLFSDKIAIYIRQRNKENPRTNNKIDACRKFLRMNTSLSIYRG